jgi:uncharacterized RDD family membrane protein YckC
MQTETSSPWKQEINRRVAEHKRRKFDAADALPFLEKPRPEASRRAQAAAARVAARYANAPSYSDVLVSGGVPAGEARAAAHVTEVEAMAGLAAQIEGQIRGQIQAEPVTAQMETVAEFERDQQPEALFAETLDAVRVEPVDDFFPPGTFSVVQAAAIEPVIATSDAQATHWEPTPRSYGLSIEELPASWLRPEPSGEEAVAGDEVENFHVNSFDVPLSVSAVRKARSRRAENADEFLDAPRQLSIFEVEPHRVSADVIWPVIELEREPMVEAEEAVAVDALPMIAAAPPTIELAQTHRRLLAGLVDAALVAGSVISVLAFSLRSADVLPGVRELELSAALGFGAALIVYQALFMALGAATPGMMYARVRLTTFDGRKPSLDERMKRFCALLISMLPVGLGMAWSIFDEEGMAWHDRLSSTYPKNRLY